MNKYIKIVVLLLISILLITGCGNQDNKEQEKVLKIGVLLIDDSLPFFVAEAENLYEKYKVKVELIPFSSAREKDLALEAGRLDGVLTDLVVTALMKKGGTDVKVVALSLGATPEEGRFAILASPQSNITRPVDLRGVPIAISNHTMIHYLAEKMSLEAGLDKEDIQTFSIPDLQLRLEALLADNDIQAALLPDPLIALAEMGGAKIIIDDTQLDTNLSQSVIIFREDVLENHGNKVASVLKAFEKGAKKLMDDPEKYQDLRMEKTRIPEPLRESYPAPTFSSLQVPTPEMVERVMEWMIEQDLLDQPYLYEEMVDESSI